MASKETLIAQRGGQRASATKCIANAKLEMSKEEEEGADSEILDSFYDKLSKKISKIKIYDSQILETLTTDAELSEETFSSDEKNIEIEITMKTLKSILRKAKKDKDEAVSKNEKGGPSFTKLPKLEIKWFSGDPLEFPTFRQQFEASIGRSNLADVAKFSYLKNLLRGRQAEQLQGFP